MTLRGSNPVHIQNVVKKSTSYEAGISPGDMIIQVNGQSVKRQSKDEVYKLIERSGTSVKLKVIAGNSGVKMSSQQKKAREFLNQVHI